MKQKNTAFPKPIEDIGNNMYAYRWNAIEEEGEPEIVLDGIIIQNKTQLWSYNEVIVWSPITANKITEKVINEIYGPDIESKYINDYNGALLGILDESYIDKYKKFLQDRKEIKEQVDADCQAFGICKV